MITNEFKPEKTNINDIVLIHKEDIPQFFARVEDISEDIKPGWFHIKLLVLTIPVQEITWILKDIYIDGTEFSMGGQKMRIEKIIAPEKDADPVKELEFSTEETKSERTDTSAEVISFSNFKK